MPPSNPISPAADVPMALTAWEIPGLVHGFCGRHGGVSAGPFASFNLAEWVGDEAGAVAENWRRWDARYPNMRVARLAQVHGKFVRHIDQRIFTHLAESLARRGGSPGEPPHKSGRHSERSPRSEESRDSSQAQNDAMGLVQSLPADGVKRDEGDGMVTATPGVALGIFTADCVPILMVDAERRVAGALHAGWRGTLAGIAGEGVRAMVALGARPIAIRAALGPSIGICCFEVDASLAEEFALQVPGARQHTRAGKPGKAYLDLRAIIHDQLEREGLEVASIANVGPCTRCANDRFFSRRGAGGATSGLQMSFIGFTD